MSGDAVLSMAACLFNEMVLDERRLAVGGRYGGLAPCPQQPRLLQAGTSIEVMMVNSY